MNAGLTFILGLTLTGILPALTFAGVTPVCIFLSPLIGAVTAGVAVEFEIGIGGTMTLWFVLLAVILNIIALAFLLRRRSFPEWQIGGWSLATVAVLLLVLAIPLTGMRAHEVGYDGAITWMTHALLISGGHKTLVSGLQNPAYLATNPDYPPLVPAVSALGFSFAGRSILILGSELTALLNAAAIGVIAVGVATVRRPSARREHLLSIAIAALVCLAGYSVGGDYIHVGNYGVDSDADLLWAAAAVAAILWGLVLPRGRPALTVAWSCAIVASLTKNEGLVTAIVILMLIAIRYQRPSLPWQHDAAGTPALRASAKSWGRCVVMWIAPTVPGLVWLAQMHFLGVQNYFFGTPTVESLGVRTSATFRAMSNSESILWVALFILAIGCIWFRNSRRLAELGHPLWLWTAWAVGNLLIAATYVFGDLEIHTWLTESVDRTTIYGKLVLLVDIAVWAILAGDQILDTYFSELRPKERRDHRVTSPVPTALGSEVVSRP
jgi:hypothetical protein